MCLAWCESRRADGESSTPPQIGLVWPVRKEVGGGGGGGGRWEGGLASAEGIRAVASCPAYVYVCVCVFQGGAAARPIFQCVTGSVTTATSSNTAGQIVVTCSCLFVVFGGGGGGGGTLSCGIFTNTQLQNSLATFALGALMLKSDFCCCSQYFFCTCGCSHSLFCRCWFKEV